MFHKVYKFQNCLSQTFVSLYDKFWPWEKIFVRQNTDLNNGSTQDHSVPEKR